MRERHGQRLCICPSCRRRDGCPLAQPSELQFQERDWLCGIEKPGRDCISQHCLAVVVLHQRISKGNIRHAHTGSGDT
ncbi:hypothetical protein VTI74DRAFT_6574 [Chaetomium olivicolor]